MNLLLGTLILADLILCCVFIYADIHEECLFQTAVAEREELLDELWADQ